MASKVLKASILLGGSISSGLRGALGETKGGLQQIGKAISDIERRQRTLGQSINTFGRMGKNVDGMRQEYGRLTTAADRLRAAQSRLVDVNKRVEANMARRDAFRGRMLDMVALGASIVAPVKAAISFESSMADVRKVVDFDTPQQFQQMTKDVIGLSRVLPMAASDIATIVAAGGQSGIAREELTRFAESAIKVGVAFGIPAEEAGQMSAEMRAAFRMTQTEIDSLFDKVNYLANTTAASEQKISSVLRRVGPLGEVAGVASGEIAALGATLIGIGVQEEVAATGIQNFMLALVAGESASKRQREAMKALGLDSKRVAAGMQKDAQGTILSVLQGARALPKERQAAVLADLFGRESLKAIAPLITVYDQLVDNMGKVTDATRYAGAVQKEFDERAKTSANNIQLFKNRIVAVGITLGNTLLPALNQVMGALGPVVTKFGEWMEANPRLTTLVVGTATAAASLAIAGTAVGYAWTFVAGGFLRVSMMLAKFRAAFAVARVAQVAGTFGRLGMVVKGVGAAVALLGGGVVVGAIAALAAGAILVVRYWQPIKAFLVGVWQGFSEAVGPAIGEVIAAMAPLRPVWDFLVGSIRKAWQWITNLIAPVDASAEQLTAAGQVGRLVGEWIAQSFRHAATIIGGVVKVVGLLAPHFIAAGTVIVSSWTRAWEIVKTVVGAAIDFMLARIKPLTDAVGWVIDKSGSIGSVASNLWNTARTAVGAGPSAPAVPGRAPPGVPAMATARTTGAGTNVRHGDTYNITQQPGESGEELARRIADEQRRREGVAARGSLVD